MKNRYIALITLEIKLTTKYGSRTVFERLQMYTKTLHLFVVCTKSMFMHFPFPMAWLKITSKPQSKLKCRFALS